MTSRDDMAGLVAELRQFAEEGFYPFDEVRDESSTGLRVIKGLVQIKEVPRSAAALMLRAADALESTSRSMEAGEVAKLLEEAAALSHDTLAGRATMRVMIIRLIEAVRALSPVPGEGVTDELIGLRFALDRCVDGGSYDMALDALRLILPLAKGYAPDGQTATAKATCQSWIEAAEAILASPATAALSPPVKGKE